MSRALNFLWINLDFASEKTTEFFQPLPARYIENIRQAAAINLDTEVRLWVDSKRLTASQREYLKAELSKNSAGNLNLQDLRSIPEYRQEALFNQAECSPNWRDPRKESLIWRQIDLAKVLISLQGDFDQVFYADIDFSKLVTSSNDIQHKLGNHGLFVRGFITNQGEAAFENQLWGFTRQRRGFFERLYEHTHYSAVMLSTNGYMSLVTLVRSELQQGEGVNLKEIYFVAEHDGTSAYHPDYPWSHGKNALSSHFDGLEFSGNEFPFTKKLKLPDPDNFGDYKLILDSLK